MSTLVWIFFGLAVFFANRVTAWYYKGKIRRLKEHYEKQEATGRNENYRNGNYRHS